jgi:hypothetical protein
MGTFYSDIENLVLWVRSEITGFVVIECIGYWNNGMLEYWVWRNEIYFYIKDIDQKLKSEHHPLFIPNISFFHHSIIS